jgi:hypothetical protein
VNKHSNHESALDLFVLLLMESLGFFNDRLIIFRKESKVSKPDFLIMDIVSFYRMVVVKDKSKEEENAESEPHLIGESISTM